MTPALPPLNLSSSASSTSGDISAPNTANFGSFGGPDIAGLIRQYWPLLLGGGLVVAIILKKKGG